jgi:ribosome-binding protein aMBF1 (putative translation factor)
MECSKCGRSDNETPLFDVISDEGIVKICNGCNSEENFPVVREPGEGIPVERRKFVPRGSSVSKEEPKSMRDLVEKNFNKNPLIGGEQRNDLVQNFHWVIMRARRAKHLSPREVAQEVGTDAVTVLRAERAMLPDDYHDFIMKLESVLGVNLIKKEKREEVQRVYSGSVKSGINFNELGREDLTIADLKRIKDEKEASILGGGRKDAPEFNEEDLKMDGDIPQEEIERLLFGRERKDL